MDIIVIISKIQALLTTLSWLSISKFLASYFGDFFLEKCVYHGSFFFLLACFIGFFTVFSSWSFLFSLAVFLRFCFLCPMSLSWFIFPSVFASCDYLMTVHLCLSHLGVSNYVYFPSVSSSICSLCPLSDRCVSACASPAYSLVFLVQEYLDNIS